MSKVERMDAELRERFQAERPQIRDWLDDFTEDEVQVAPEFESSILPAERDPVVGLGSRLHIWKPVSLWAMPIQNRHLSSNAGDGQWLKRRQPYQARIGATKSRAALNFNSPGVGTQPGWRYFKYNFVSAGFTNKTALNEPLIQGGMKF